jgi:hypothetical protein
MGLDMYLTAKKYVSDFGFRPKHKELNASIKESLGFGTEDYGYIQVELEVAYWRKSNEIHAWFVDNVQKGTDDCGTYYVSKEKLTELRDLAKKALETKDDTLLPTRSGFFFGPTDIDEYYWEDLAETVSKLSKVLEDARLQDDWSLYYHSSW